MRKLFVVLFALTALMVNAQSDLKPIAREVYERSKTKATFAEYDDLFVSSSRVKSTAAEPTVEGANFMDLQPAVLQRILKEDPENLILTVPSKNGDLRLTLYRVNIFAEGFFIEGSDGSIEKPEGEHFHGIVENDPSTLVAISLFPTEVSGIVSYEDDNQILGKIEGDNLQHVLFSDSKLEGVDVPTCAVTDEYMQIAMPTTTKSATAAEATKCVNLYWEADYPIYQDKGGNTNNYITGLFNQSKILFDNDGITVKLSQLYVWKSSSPYGSGSSTSRLTNFRNNRSSYNGNLAHLLSYGGGGGVAWVRGLCGSYSYAYSGINGSYNNYPTYSWSVMVVTHEQGHGMGSEHTHACKWNGNNTAIDGCYATEGGCARPAVPSGGGTIMSYCHTQSAGINLTKGFGPQPRDRIKNFVNSRGCLSSSCSGGGGGGSDAPIGSIVYFKGNNGKYVSSENGSKAMMCNRGAVGAWEKFEVVDAGGGKIALKGNNGKYVCSENGSKAMNCNRGALGAWEKFTWVVQSSNSVAFKGNNGKYVSSENGSKGMTCTSGSIGSLQKFGWATTSRLAQTIDTISDLNSISIYPNPIEDGIFYIEGLNANENISMQIVNINGQMLLSETLFGSELYDIDLKKTKLTNGIYFIRIFNANQVITKRIILD